MTRGLRLLALTLAVAFLTLLPDPPTSHAAPPKSTTKAAVHVVKVGDTLYNISTRYGTTVSALVATNRLAGPDATLRIGQRLTLPRDATVQRPAPSGRATATSSPSKASGRAAATQPPSKARKPAQTAARRVKTPSGSSEADGATGSANGSPRPPASLASARVASATNGSTAVTTNGGIERRQVASLPPSANGRRSLPPPKALVLTVPDFTDAVPLFSWPIDGQISSMFGRRKTGWHRGIDIKADLGTPIMAAAPGTVVTSGFEHRYGKVVKIEHNNGFMTVYAHNDENLVEIGDRVTAGQIIAAVGRTGRATSYHVHFEIRQAGLAYNPLYLLPLPPRVTQIEDSDEEEPEDADE